MGGGPFRTQATALAERAYGEREKVRMEVLSCQFPSRPYGVREVGE